MKIKIAHIGDTHARNVFSSADIKLLKKVKPDLFIHTGDVTSTNPYLHANLIKQAYYSYKDIDEVSHLFGDKFVIGANHDTFLDKTHKGYYKNIDEDMLKYGDILKMYNYVDSFIENTKGLSSGVEFHTTKQGLKVLTIPYTEPIDFLIERDGIDPWGFHFTDEIKKEILELIENNGGKVDIIATHGPPKGHLDEVKRKPGLHVGSEFMLYLIEHYQPKIYLCGHIHEDAGESKLGKTIIINNAQPAYEYDDDKVYVKIISIKIK